MTALRVRPNWRMLLINGLLHFGLGTGKRAANLATTRYPVAALANLLLRKIAPVEATFSPAATPSRI